MKFMKQVGDGEIDFEEGMSEQEAQNWGEEYLNIAAKEDSELLAQNWANEHTTNTGKILTENLAHSSSFVFTR